MPYVYKNIMQHAAGIEPAFTVPSSIPTVMLASLGPEVAIMAMNGMIML